MLNAKRTIVFKIVLFAPRNERNYCNKHENIDKYIHWRRRQGQWGRAPSVPQRKWGKYFLGNYHVKFGNFVNFQANIM